MKQLLRTKPINLDPHASTTDALKRCLHASDLILLGIGAIIGAGIFAISGIAAATESGPAVVLSFIIAGLVCTFTALCYAELASSIGGSGGAYGYAYAGLGEFFAWFIGWNLILEYGLTVPTVAVSWGGYVDNAFDSMGIHLPQLLLAGPFSGGLINLPPMLVIGALTVLLCVGTKQSAKFNSIIVFIKLLAIAVFIGVACFHIQPHLWKPFMPFGFNGVMGGAALVFFSYIGFDAVATASEESVNPQRDLPIGIIFSLLICTLIYIVIAGLLTGIVSYATLNVSAPVSEALLSLKLNFVAGLIAAGAIAGLTTTILVMFYGLTRVFYAISKDGLLPPFCSKLNTKTQTPTSIIIFCGVLMMLTAGLTPINALAELVNIGTLAAFATVCIGVLILRIRQPNLSRPYKVPLYPFIPILGTLSCVYLMINLPIITWLRFFIWTLIGILIYFSYSYKNSFIGKSFKG